MTTTTRQEIAITSADVFPSAYHFFFTVIEPALTVAGVVYAVFSPVKYHQNLVPTAMAQKPLEFLIHPASVMAVRQLGSCFFLLALFATIFVRRTYNTLAAQPALLEPIVHSYLLCLAIADWTHIIFTLYDLGLHWTLKPQYWNQLVCGNVVITAGLFLVRALWFAGVGRKTTVIKSKSE